jgi:sugar phosphate isomerase/epimerase
MKIGMFISVNLLSSLGVEGSLALARELGLEGVQLWNVGSDLDPGNLSPDGRRWFKALVAAHGLEISALCGHNDFVNPDGIEQRIETFKRVLDLAVDLEAPLVTTESGEPTANTDRDWETLISAFRQICTHAEEVGALVAIEPAGTYGLVDASPAVRRLLDSVASPNLKVNFDPANAMDGGDDPAQAVYALRDWIVHTHAKDGFRQPWRETPLGQGQVDWASYMAALRDIGYDGFLTIEREMIPDPANDIAAAKDFLTRVLK